MEPSTDPDGTGMRMAFIVWVYFLSKFLEFFDTFFFVARKKFGNISALHVCECSKRVHHDDNTCVFFK